METIKPQCEPINVNNNQGKRYRTDTNQYKTIQTNKTNENNDTQQKWYEPMKTNKTRKPNQN